MPRTVVLKYALQLLDIDSRQCKQDASELLQQFDWLMDKMSMRKCHGGSSRGGCASTPSEPASRNDSMFDNEATGSILIL